MVFQILSAGNGIFLPGLLTKSTLAPTPITELVIDMMVHIRQGRSTQCWRINGCCTRVN
jgi:hypothetical protein